MWTNDPDDRIGRMYERGHWSDGFGFVSLGFVKFHLHLKTQRMLSFRFKGRTKFRLPKKIHLITKVEISGNYEQWSLSSKDDVYVRVFQPIAALDPLPEISVKPATSFELITEDSGSVSISYTLPPPPPPVWEKLTTSSQHFYPEYCGTVYGIGCFGLEPVSFKFRGSTYVSFVRKKFSFDYDDIIEFEKEEPRSVYLLHH